MERQDYTFTSYGEDSNPVLLSLTEEEAKTILNFIHITENVRREKELYYAPHLDMRRTIDSDTLIGEIKDCDTVLDDLRSDLSKDFMDRGWMVEDEILIDRIESWTVTRENLLLEYIRQGDTKVYEL